MGNSKKEPAPPPQPDHTLDLAKMTLSGQAKSDEEATKRAQFQEESKLNMMRLQNQQAIETAKMQQTEAQNARVYATEIKNMEQKSKMELMAAEKDLERQQQEHEATLKQMMIAAEQADKESKIKQKDAALERIANITAQLNQTLDTDKEDLVTTEQLLGVTQASLKKNELDMTEFPNKKVVALDIFKHLPDIAYNKKKDAFDRDDKEVRAAIESTGQHEDNVGRFLRLTHNLVGATLVTQANTNSLDTKLQTFNQLIETITSDRLTIKNYFQDKKLGRFVPILKAEGMEDLDDLVCDDEEYQEVLELIQNGLEGQLEEWQAKNEESKSNDKAPSTKMNFKEKKTLKAICLKSEQMWIKDQNDKKKITKRSLMSVSPVLGKFFGGCYVGMNQVQEMLSYETKLNDSQVKAIKMADKVDNESDEKKSNEDARDSWEMGSQVQIYSEQQQEWYNGQVVKVFTDDEGEWLNVQYQVEQDAVVNVDVQRGSDKVKPLDLSNFADSDLQVAAINKDDLSDEFVVECRALSKAAKLTVSVLATMEEDFERNKDTMRSKSVAIGVEDSCKQIIVSQGSIRQSVLLAQKIMSFKPSNMKNETTQQLWNSLDGAIVHIFKSALEMVDVSVKYFAFFLMFKNSFQYFESCYDDDNDPALTVSCEYIRRDVRKFCEFSIQFTKTVERLRNDAMNCIESCVKTQKGFESFENAKESRKKTVDAYLVAKAKVDAHAYEWDQKLEDYRLKRTLLAGDEKKMTYKQEMLHNRIKQNESYLERLDEQKVVLNQII